MKKLFCCIFVLLLAAPPLLADGPLPFPTTPPIVLIVPEGLNKLEDVEDIEDLEELKQEEVAAIQRFKQDLKYYWWENSRESFEKFAIIPRKRMIEIRNRGAGQFLTNIYQYLVDIEIVGDRREVFKECKFRLDVHEVNNYRMIYLRGCSNDRWICPRFGPPHLRKCSNDNSLNLTEGFFWLSHSGHSGLIQFSEK